MSNFDQFFVGLPITLQLQPTSFFIGSTPRLAEDVVRLVPVFPPATREGVSSVPALNIGVGALGFAEFMHSSGMEAEQEKFNEYHRLYCCLTLRIDDHCFPC